MEGAKIWLSFVISYLPVMNLLDFRLIEAKTSCKGAGSHTSASKAGFYHVAVIKLDIEFVSSLSKDFDFGS
jgi:hypothetical protein